MGEKIAENEDAAKQLEAANADSKKCYDACGNVQKCAVEHEQCKDPWQNTGNIWSKSYNSHCRRSNSCGAGEEKQRVCTKRPWWNPFGCSSYANECCRRVMKSSWIKSCKEDFDDCIKPKSSWWDIGKAVFSGDISVAWCSTKCKAKDTVVAAKVAWLKTKALALKAINAVSKGVKKVWSAMKKYAGMIITVNNITAHGMLSSEGQALNFKIDMKVLGIPVKADLHLTPKDGKEIDTKSIAEKSFDQTRNVIESGSEEELQLMDLDLSGLESTDVVVQQAVADELSALEGAKLVVSAHTSIDGAICLALNPECTPSQHIVIPDVPVETEKALDK